MYCSRCGTLNPAPARFCITCGQVIFRVPVAPLPYAEFFQRFLARLIDSLVLSPLLLGWAGLVFWVVQQIPKFPRGGEKLSEQDVVRLITLMAPAVAFAILWVIVSIAGNWLYHALLESSGRQGTVGKRVIGLVVTDLEGRRISFGRASVRWLCATLITSQTMLIGYIMVAFTEKKQTLHDMLAQTVVLNGAPPPEP